MVSAFDKIPRFRSAGPCVKLTISIPLGIWNQTLELENYSTSPSEIIRNILIDNILNKG